jgi:hypothetical protein
MEKRTLSLIEPFLSLRLLSQFSNFDYREFPNLRILVELFYVDFKVIAPLTAYFSYSTVLYSEPLTIELFLCFFTVSTYSTVTRSRSEFVGELASSVLPVNVTPSLSLL